MKLSYLVFEFVLIHSISFGQLKYTVDDQTVTEMGSGNLSSNKHVPYTLYRTDIYSNDIYDISEQNGITTATIKRFQTSDNWDNIGFTFLDWQGNANFYFMYDINGDPQEHKTAYGYVVDFTNPENRYLTLKCKPIVRFTYQLNRDIVGSQTPISCYYSAIAV